MHYVKYKKWWNTKTISQAGKLWKETGEYCPFPAGTPAYYEFWDEQEDYIQNGYMHEGERIAGLHYLYLNYCPIKDKKKKKLDFPDFWAVDAEYFWELETVLDLGPKKDEFRPVIFEVSKSRQVGASLKGVVPLLYNMNFVPDSNNYIGSYLAGDAEKTTRMFLEYFYHTQRYCEFGKRFLIEKSMEEYVTGYHEIVDGNKVPAGFKSSLRLITWKDNPEKGVGGSADLVIVEEAGLHPELITSLKFISPACKDGDYTTGNILVYGAAGKEGQYEGLAKLHHKPRAYGAKAYSNRWEPDSPHKETGYFIPNYSCRKGHIDEHGNPNQESAIIARDKAIEELEKTDHEAWLLEISQYPNNSSEMFNSRSRKRFATKLIERQIAYLEANNIRGEAVELYEDVATGRIGYYSMDERHKRPIREYPLNDTKNIEGCVEIFEHPDIDPVDGLYIAGIDSYNQQDANSTSLGSIFIYKRVSDLAGEGTHRIVVAEYAGRPKDKYDWYRTCAYLLRYYNATAMLENEDHEASPWFVNNNYEHLLADQPDIINLYVKKSTVKRSKGIHADVHLIIAAENKIDRYIREELGPELNDKGEVVGKRHGVNRILSLALLHELRDYISDKNKNFDRVRSFGWTLMYETEVQLDAVKAADPQVAKFLANTSRFRKKGAPQALLQRL